MPTCEKCWSDAHRGPQFSVSEEYQRLIDEREGHPCTPEQQAGPDATRCEKCNRMTRHQHCGVCMNCGDDPDPRGFPNARIGHGGALDRFEAIMGEFIELQESAAERTRGLLPQDLLFRRYADDVRAALKRGDPDA